MVKSKFILTVGLLCATLTHLFGQQSIFPFDRGIGQTWNRSLTKRIGQVVALEARQQGVKEFPLPTFGYGESSYLVAELGIEMSKGLNAFLPLTGLDRTIKGGVEFQAAFDRIIQESGILTDNQVERVLPELTEEVRKDHAAVAMQAFRESVVLVKNENSVLPIARNKRICVSAPYYNSKEQGKALAEARKYDVLTVVWDAETAGKRDALIWLKTLCALGKPVVLVLSGDEGFEIEPLIDKSVTAIIAAWFPKGTGGELIGDVIRGNYAPGSRLTAPIYDKHGNVLYPRGHGLSYTTVAYSDLSIFPVDADGVKNYVVRFNVTNTGKRASDEVALLYLQKVSDATTETTAVRIEGFKRTHLKAGETKEVKFTIRPRNLVGNFGECQITLSGNHLTQRFTFTQ